MLKLCMQLGFSDAKKLDSKILPICCTGHTLTHMRVAV